MRLPRSIRVIVGDEITVWHFAWLSIAAAVVLSLLGIYAIDVGVRLDPEHVPPPGSAASADAAAANLLVFKQSIFLGLGVFVALIVAIPHHRYIRALAWPAMAVSLALLLFLLIPGVPASIVRPRNGARAWIDLGPLELQPGEIAKLAVILVLASYFEFRASHRTLLGLIPPALITLVPVGLIMLEPDLGTALLFVPCLFAMLLAAGARMKHLSAIVLIGVLAGPAAYPLLKPHQKERIVGLVKMIQGSSQGADAVNYQSLTAVRLAGAGGLTGLPDARSRALVHFNSLPERHNDMIFAVIVNRFGLLGGLGVLLLYGVWLLGAILTAALCRDGFGRLVVIGCMVVVAAQMYINIGMNLALLPIIGLTLPFVSYGGSSMLTVWIMNGLILNVAMRPPGRYLRPVFEFKD